LLDERRRFSMLDPLSKNSQCQRFNPLHGLCAVRPYAIAPGICGISAIQRPSFSFSISTANLTTDEESAKRHENSNFF
jgi:hypothetical protein